MPKKKEEILKDEIPELTQEGDADDEEDDIAAEEDPVAVEDDVVKESVRMTGDVPVQVVAVLGKKTVSVKELIGFKMGQVIDLARPANEVVDLVAGGKLVAKGELVEIDGKLGVRIVKMIR
ncbi:MAG: hypothetical protein A3I09_04275 [Deltaproteobacteria bacterium RIFCSPLOWO2_02_FULL_47_10]|nr:MAG: hypothetical protein A3I09_04275 [Deltaproteobacteria bacterium RIFCSPLOWO2_02_FULL_47_10]